MKFLHFYKKFVNISKKLKHIFVKEQCHFNLTIRRRLFSLYIRIFDKKLKL